MKACAKCGSSQPLDAYYTSKRHADGLMAHCKACESTRSRIKNERHRAARLERSARWRKERREVYEAGIARWREQNPERMRETYRAYAAINRGKLNAKWMQRDAAKKQRTPAWLTADDLAAIETLYERAAMLTQATGIEHHVDHFYPLQGKIVSGLHVPINLRVIPAKENREKCNKHPEAA